MSCYNFQYRLSIDTRTVSYKSTWSSKERENLPNQRLWRSTCTSPLLPDDGRELLRAAQVGAEPKRGTLWSCAKAFLCLNQGQSLLSGPRIGTARLKTEKRKKERYTNVQKDCFQHFMILFEHYLKLNPERACRLLPLGIYHLRGTVTEIEECILPKHVKTFAPPLPIWCWGLCALWWSAGALTIFVSMCGTSSSHLASEN